MKIARFLLALFLALSVPLFAQEEEPGANTPALDPARQAKLVQTLRPGLVRVEFEFQFDKGEAPQGWGGGHESNYAQLIKDERPLELGGYLVGEGTVAVADPLVHPRFLKSIAVRQGDQRVTARIQGVLQLQNTLLLQIDIDGGPLVGATPLRFDPAKPGPYYAVGWGRDDASWTVTVTSLPEAIECADSAPPRLRTSPYALVVDQEGVAVSLPMGGDLPADGSWKMSPHTWPAVVQAELDQRLATLAAAADAAILRVSLSFRSPKKSDQRGGGRGRFMRHRGGDDDDEATEQNALGLVLAERRILVLAGLEPAVTARLERIVVHPAQGEAVAAKFQHTLADYGAFLAELEAPLAGAPALARGDIRARGNDLLLVADVQLQGETRLGYYRHNRFSGFEDGWRRNVYPQLASWSGNMFVFDWKGELLALPLTRRERVATEQDWRHEQAILTSADQIAPLLADPGAHVDPSNVPLSEDEENRLAWLGVELQPLDRELARINEVAEHTRDGSTGAIVSYVYPGSPAAAAGIEPGAILLRLHVTGRPKPVDIELEEGFGGWGNFPWEQLDQVPEQYFDQIPPPWTSATDSFNKTLTDLGFGTAFKADFFVGGQPLTKDFTVEQSPPHHAAAKRHKSESLGFTVADLTYEVRRYFQKSPEDVGVIVAEVKPGSKAAVAGLKPFEIIKEVDDTPIKDVAAFEQAIKDKAELRLAVQRMTKDRIVRMAVGQGGASESEDSEAPEPDTELEPTPDDEDKDEDE